MSVSACITRPLPDLNDKLYALYFEALRNYKLVVQHCEDCEHSQWPAREFCFHCHGTRFRWQEVKQQGVVYTYSIAYRAFHPWFKDHLPYGIAVVELDQGIRMLGNYFGPDVESLECGMKVKASFEKVNDQVTLLHWEKDN